MSKDEVLSSSGLFSMPSSVNEQHFKYRGLEGKQMRLYAVADIHGRADRMAAIKNNIKVYRPDLLVAAGDITNFARILPVISELGDLSIPVLAIRGNTDLKRVEYQMLSKGNIHFLNHCALTFQGVHFTGISGALPIPFRSRIAFREASIWSRLLPLITPETVLIAHPPPWGALDRVMGKFHAGCKSLQKVIVQYRPALLICGHIHEDAGLEDMGNTRIVNCAMGCFCEGAIIDITHGQITAEILKGEGKPTSNPC
jgi:uncharacterized protein